MAAALSPLGLAGSAALPSRRTFPGVAPQAAAARRPRCRPSRLRVAAGRRLSEADLYQGIAPAGQVAPQPAGQPWYITGALAFLGIIAALRAAKALKKNM